MKTHPSLSSSNRRIGARRASLALGAALLLAWTPLTSGATEGARSLSAAGGSSKAQAYKTVAALSVELPQASDFNLRGTFPVPKGTFPRADGLVPFGVQGPDGVFYPAQMEPVSWYPKRAADGADVVEILAHVNRPAGMAPGQAAQYDIVDRPHASRSLRPTPAVSALLSQPRQILVRTRDVFGHLYELDLLYGGQSGKKILRDGRVALQFRAYGTLRPKTGNLGAPTGALSHMMGVHAYVTYWDRDDTVTLDLRFSNGASGASATPLNAPQQDMYFDSLELVVPQGWAVQQLFDDPFWGVAKTQGNQVVQPIVRPLSNGKMHIMHQRSQFHRRLVVAPSNQSAHAREVLRSAGLGFCVDGKNTQGQAYYSWWNPKTARYFPTNTRLPHLDWIPSSSVHQNLSTTLSSYENLLASGGSQGSYPILSKVLGWAHPWGVKYGGMTGGSEIYALDGVKTADAAEVDGYLVAEITHRMYVDRMPIAFYDQDGEPSRYEDWLQSNASVTYLPFNYFNVMAGSEQPPGWAGAPKFQADYVRQNNLDPNYESDLVGHSPIDQQHFIRWTRSPKVLAWLGNDALAKDDLALSAEAMFMSYTPYAVSASGYTAGSSLLADKEYATSNPGKGMAFGRGEAWSIDTVNAAYALGDPVFRMRAQSWFEEILDTVEMGQQSCTGIMQSIVSNALLGGQYHVRQAFEQALIEISFTGMLETVFKDRDPARAARMRTVLQNSIYSLVTGASWSSSQGGPWITLAVDDMNLQDSPFCGTIPPGGTSPGVEKNHSFSSLEFGMRLTQDPLFLQRSGEMMGVGPNASANTILKEFYKTYFSYLENRAPLIGALQLQATQQP